MPGRVAGSRLGVEQRRRPERPCGTAAGRPRPDRARLVGRRLAGSAGLSLVGRLRLGGDLVRRRRPVTAASGSTAAARSERLGVGDPTGGRLAERPRRRVGSSTAAGSSAGDLARRSSARRRPPARARPASASTLGRAPRQRAGHRGRSRLVRRTRHGCRRADAAGGGQRRGPAAAAARRGRARGRVARSCRAATRSGRAATVRTGASPATSGRGDLRGVRRRRGRSRGRRR